MAPIMPSMTRGFLLSAILTLPALAAEKPALGPDQPVPIVTPSHVSATIEFALPALARAIERDIPKRLATIHDRISCVHRRVLFVRVNANCDVSGYVERTGPVALRGERDILIGSVPIYGTMSGQGANRITAHVHGEGEGRMTVEAESRPQLRRDWSVDLHFSDSFHWTEPPILQVLGHEFNLSRFVEPKIRSQLERVRGRTAAAAKALDLRGKAETAWRRAYDPIKLADNPDIWLQLTPKSAAFAGVRANAEVLQGSLEIDGTAETFVGHAPVAVSPAPLPQLGSDVAAPGAFEIVVPVRIAYDALRQKIQELIAASGLKTDTQLRDMEVYPSSGKIIVGLRFAKTSEADPNAGDWIYLSSTPRVDADAQSLQLPDLAAAASASEGAASDLVKWLDETKIFDILRQRLAISYKEAYEKLIASANARLTRPLGNGFRMEGRLAAARVDKILLLPDGLSVQLRASGALKISYGL